MIPVILAGDSSRESPAQYALSRLAQALESRGCRVQRVEALPTPAGAAIAFVAAIAAAERESFTIRPLAASDGLPPTVFLTGGDARGLMYALLEAARRIELAPTSTLSNSSSFIDLFPPESAHPERKLRSLTVFPHDATLEAEWYRSVDFWDWYFDLLALHRFNRFTLTYGHQTAYLAPPYPHFVAVPEHPEVTVPGLTPQARDENLALLQGIAHRATERGIDFALGVWSQHAHTFGKSMVDGLDHHNLASFCGHGIRRLVAAVPEITAVQLRVNSESGVHLDEGARFWRSIFDGVAAAAHSSDRRITLDLRAKAITEDTIAAGLATGLPVVVNTKFWTEHHGLPYHATLLQEGDRYVKRHSYGDQLRYPGGQPRAFDYLFQLWNLGTNRVLLWADPDWVRRFAGASTLGGSVGFEVCAPLSHKGFGQRGGAWRIFKDRSLDWYRWEQERYWPWYALFGRLGYSGDAAPDSWRREWAARVGVDAAPLVEQSLAAASRVLPLLTARHSPSASVFGYWPEKDMGGLLDLYLQIPGSDVAMFASAQETVKADLNHGGEVRQTPREASEVLTAIAADAEASLDAALHAACPVDEQAARELRGLALDVRIQSQLARYHAAKGEAALHLAWFYETGNFDSLLAARGPATRALEEWQRLAALTEGVYQDNLIFGRSDDQDGHWKDNLVYAHRDVQRLDEVEDVARRYGLFDLAFDFGPQLSNRTGTPPLPFLHDHTVERRFKPVGPQTLYSPERGYGWGGTYGLVAAEGPKLDSKTLRASGPRPAQLPREPLFSDHIGRHPAAPYDNATFLVDLPNGEYQATIVLADRSVEPRDHGPMTVRLQARHESPALDISAGQIVEWRHRVSITNGRLDLEISAPAQADFLLTALILTRVAPHLGHRPPLCARPGQPFQLQTSLTSPEPLASTSVHYRFDSASPFISTPLTITAKPDSPHLQRLCAHLDVPADASTLDYYLEAADIRGTITHWPSAGPSSPRRLHVGASANPPGVHHDPITRARPGQPIEIRTRIAAAAPLSRVTLLYRNLNQFQTHDRLEMIPLDPGSETYTATIPGPHVSVEWDLIYHLEVLDALGNHTIHPGLTAPVPYVIVPVDR